MSEAAALKPEATKASNSLSVADTFVLPFRNKMTCHRQRSFSAPECWGTQKSAGACQQSAAYARLPDTLRLRELRYRVQKPGFRTRDVTLVTTLLDPHKYSKEELAALYAKRWQVETHLKHLKQTLGMDTLRTKSPDNILKELCMYVLVYNLVRLVMLDASRRQQVPMSRISFIDALRSLRHALPGSQPRPLNTIPARPGRFEPRVRKRRPKQFSVMIRARSWYRKRKTSTCSAQS